MVSLINFGSLTTIGGKTVTTGSASGLDTEALVNSLVEAKSIPKTKIEDSIALKTSQNSALSEYKQLLSTFQSTLNALRNPPGVNKDANNIFQYRTAFLTASDGSSASNYLGVSVNAGATLGNYDVTVDNLALAASNTSISFSSRTDDIATLTGAGGTPKAGTFTLNGSSVTIEVGDSLDDIKTKINVTTSTSGVKADIIKVSDTEYKLKITAVDTGEDNDYAVAGDTTVFDSMFTGVGSSSQLAENSEITFNGLTIERQSNSFDDLIDGVTFSLYQETAATLKVDIEPDREKAANAIGNFVDSFNNIKTFIAQQQQRDEDGNLLETAVLGENTLLNNFISSANVTLSSVVSGLTGDYDDLSSLGITFTDYVGDDENPAIKNILQFDEAKISAALEADFDAVRAVFEFNLSSNAPDKLAIFSRTNSFEISEFDLDIDYTRADGDQVRVLYTDSDGNPQTINADIDIGTQASSVGVDVSEGIFGATDAATAFTGLVDGDQFRITVNNIDGSSTDYDFTYMAAPVGATEFNSLDTLATAIDGIADITASVSDGRLVITPTAQLSTLAFTNLTATDFINTVGLADTNLPSATITGQEDTVLEGLVFVYASRDGTDVIDVEITQGIADKIYNTVDGYTALSTGLLDKEVELVGQQKAQQELEVARLDDVIAAYRERLLEQFAALERAVSSVNSLLQLLDAQNKARENA